MLYSKTKIHYTRISEVGLRVTGRQSVQSVRETVPSATMAAGRGSRTECTKSLQDHCTGKKPFPTLTKLGVGSGKGRNMVHRSQNSAGGGAEPKRPVGVAWGRKGFVGRWAIQGTKKSGKLTAFWKAPGLSHTQANIIPWEQREIFSCLWLACS